jgi:hypothetical protein
MANTMKELWISGSKPLLTHCHTENSNERVICLNLSWKIVVMKEENKPLEEPIPSIFIKELVPSIFIKRKELL